MSVYLNECPICGGKAELTHAYETRVSHAARDAYYCECSECGKSTDEYLSEEEAAEVWNRSRASDLKDTGERVIRSVVIKPLKVFTDTFSRIFLLLVVPVLLFFLAFSTKFDLAWWLWGAYGFIFVFWLGFGIPMYAKFAANRNRLIRHLPRENRAANIFADVMGIAAALAALALIYWFVFVPIAAVSQNVEHIPFRNSSAASELF